MSIGEKCYLMASPLKSVNCNTLLIPIRYSCPILLETFEESSINVPLYILNNKMQYSLFSSLQHHLNNKMQYSLFLFIVLSSAILCMINQKKKKKKTNSITQIIICNIYLLLFLFNSIIRVINPKKQKQKKLANSIITINQSRAVARGYILV